MNLTQHQKDDYLIKIKEMSDVDLLNELSELVQYYRNEYNRWCFDIIISELKLRLYRRNKNAV